MPELMPELVVAPRGQAAHLAVGPDFDRELARLVVNDLADILSIARGKVPLRLRLRLSRRAA